LRGSDGASTIFCAMPKEIGRVRQQLDGGLIKVQGDFRAARQDVGYSAASLAHLAAGA
jgi:hypothetical protein